MHVRKRLLVAVISIVLLVKSAAQIVHAFRYKHFAVVMQIAVMVRNAPVMGRVIEHDATTMILVKMTSIVIVVTRRVSQCALLALIAMQMTNALVKTAVMMHVRKRLLVAVISIVLLVKSAAQIVHAFRYKH